MFFESRAERNVDAFYVIIEKHDMFPVIPLLGYELPLGKQFFFTENQFII